MSVGLPTEKCQITGMLIPNDAWSVKSSGPEWYPLMAETKRDLLPTHVSQLDSPCVRSQMLAFFNPSMRPLTAHRSSPCSHHSSKILPWRFWTRSVCFPARNKNPQSPKWCLQNDDDGQLCCLQHIVPERNELHQFEHRYLPRTIMAQKKQHA